MICRLLATLMLHLLQQRLLLCQQFGQAALGARRWVMSSIASRISAWPLLS